MGKRKRNSSLSKSDQVKNGLGGSPERFVSLEMGSKRRQSKGGSLELIVLDRPVEMGQEKDASLDDEKAEDVVSKSVPLRTSARVLSKLKREVSPQPGEKNGSKAPDESKTDSCAEMNPETPKRKRRSWELWSMDDKNTFFEALNEYGKDFESIQNYFASKVKKKGLAAHIMKNKDQVRHFYYRTWHKISKHLDFSNGVKKSTQELYALVNYGELRRRIGSKMDSKNGVRLRELVFQGWTTVRVRGKAMRIKTPLCKALKKLNQVEDQEEDHVKLPNLVTVELRPHSNRDWADVQATAQNPRIKVTLSLQRRLATLIRYLEKKWEPKTKHCDQILSFLDHLPSTRSRCLRVLPPAGTRINLLQVKTGEVVTSRGLSLKMYEERMQSQGCHPAPSSSSPKRAAGGGGKSTKCSGVRKSSVGEEAAVEVKLEAEEPHEVALRQLLALETAANPGDVDNDVICLEDGYRTGMSRREELDEDKVPVGTGRDPVEEAQRISEGWTTEDAGRLTIGELYLMIGRNEKITLEYHWENSGSREDQSPVANVTSMLRTLLWVAQASLSKQSKGSLPLPCQCGHTCPPLEGVVGSPPTTSKTQGQHKGGRKSGKDKAVSPPKSSNVSTPTPPVPVAAAQIELPSATHDGLFRRPLLLPLHAKRPESDAEQAFKEQLEKFRPKYCNRTGRNRTRRGHVVVQRVLPLLPKADTNHSMVTLKVIPNYQQRHLTAGSFVPLSVQTQLPATQNTVTSLPGSSAPATLPGMPGSSTVHPNLAAGTANQISVIKVTNANIGSITNQRNVTAPQTDATVNQTDTVVPSVNVASVSATIPTQNYAVSVAAGSAESPRVDFISILDIGALPVRSEETGKLLDVALGDSDSSLSGLLDAAKGSTREVKTSPVVRPEAEDTVEEEVRTAPTSPSRILRDTDNQWLNGEVGDFSLSSLLGHLESPQKMPVSGNSAIVMEESSRMSCDVDSQLQCLMIENSVDYTAKFADLAAQISATVDTPVKK